MGSLENHKKGGGVSWGGEDGEGLFALSSLSITALLEAWQTWGVNSNITLTQADREIRGKNTSLF